MLYSTHFFIYTGIYGILLESASWHVENVKNGRIFTWWPQMTLTFDLDLAKNGFLLEPCLFPIAQQEHNWIHLPTTEWCWSMWPRYEPSRMRVIFSDPLRTNGLNWRNLRNKKVFKRLMGVPCCLWRPQEAFFKLKSFSLTLLNPAATLVVTDTSQVPPAFESGSEWSSFTQILQFWRAF